MILAALAAVLFLIGLVLLVRGIQQRSASSTPDVWVPPVQQLPTAPPPPPAGGDFSSAPAPPAEAPSAWSSAPPPMMPPVQAAKSGGTVPIVAGAVLMAFGVLAGFAALGNACPKRTITMPAALEGNPENASITGQVRSEVLEELRPHGLKSADAAVYGTPPKLIVVTGVGRLSSPDNEIDAFLKGASESGATLENLHDVDAGPLGGKAQCGSGTVSGVKATVCVFADRGSFLATFEVGSGGTDADARALDVRNQVIHKA